MGVPRNRVPGEAASVVEPNVFFDVINPMRVGSSAEAERFQRLCSGAFVERFRWAASGSGRFGGLTRGTSSFGGVGRGLRFMFRAVSAAAAQMLRYRCGSWAGRQATRCFG